MLKVSAKDPSKFEDQAKDLDPTILQLVQSALKAQLSSFSTPTSDMDENRIEWQTRKWVLMRSGKPTCFLVAYRIDNAHCEILGPEIPL